MKEKHTVNAINISMLGATENIDIFLDSVAIYEESGVDGFSKNPYRIHTTFLSICKSGYCILEVNTIRYVLCAGKAISPRIDDIFQIIEVSDDFHASCIAISKNLSERNHYKVENINSYSIQLGENRLLELTQEEYRQLNLSCDYFKEKFYSEYDDTTKLKILENLIILHFYEEYEYSKKIMEESNMNSSRTQSLFDQFTSLVIREHRKEHSLKYYANRLFISPKYLSVVTNSICGKGAKQWIDEYIILDAKVLLKSTDLTIQQISDELNFSDSTFFGKFFKRIEKMTPNKYRKNIY